MAEIQDDLECPSDHDKIVYTGVDIWDAANRGDAAQLMELLQGAEVESVNWVDIDCTTPLLAAVINGNFICCELLISHPLVDANKCDGNGLTPLHHAAMAGNVECLEKLLSHDRISINKSDKAGGYTSLHRATAANHANCVQLLLAADTIDVNLPRNDGSTSLSDAAFKGNVDCLELLLSHPNIDVNKSACGWSPLRFAIEEGQVESVAMLVAHPDIDINFEWTGGTDRSLLHAAIHHSLPECVRLLVRHPKIDVNKAGQAGVTPLHTASSRAESACLSLLLCHPDIDVNRADENGFSPFHVGGLRECCLLFSAGAVSAVGEVPPAIETFWEAFEIPDQDRAKDRSELATARATYLDMQEHNSWTPLIRAAWTADIDTCLELIREGADQVEAENFNGSQSLKRDHKNRNALDVYGTLPFTCPPLDPEEREAGVAQLKAELQARKDRIWARRWPLLDALTGSIILLTASRVAQLLHVDPSIPIAPILRDSKARNWAYLLLAVLGNPSITKRVSKYT